ncbi:hypothetical protein JCGZ_00731 [Jatropha curcas]|uniref:Protein kinase domain-containing protein n=1 Tax=Jatropha curcas TaxID=180498 RepID=A0A067L4F0_JATCU|nr:hypothetical protein JCGZ_00731 [Jatropha curcas]
MQEIENMKGKEDMELLIFDLTTTVRSTDNFSSNNKLGECGFGPVYKGMLTDGKEIAVKRILKGWGQGMTEFKNKVILASKLQHRNLLDILPTLIKNGLDQTRSKLLDWPERIHIIDRIARGLLYLHQDSRAKQMKLRRSLLIRSSLYSGGKQRFI